MQSCSKYTYIKQNLKGKSKVKDDFQEENWEVNSDELNEEFDSDDEGNPAI